MALRVLLADESATIKKVMQISLQDFAVDLKNINLGTDALDTAKSFKPDIIFVDILLQKKSGYEVARELKAAPETQNIPVVLLWNGFMDLDKEKLAEANADEKLEKPFDSEALRKLVMRLVPKLQSNPVSRHIIPPQIEWDIEEQHIEGQKNEESESESWSMDSFEDMPLPDFDPSLDDNEPDSFSPVKLNEVKEPEQTSSISKFKLDLPSDELGDLSSDSEESMEKMEIDTSNFLWGNEEPSKNEEAWEQKPLAKAKENAEAQEQEIESKKEKSLTPNKPQTGKNTISPQSLNLSEVEIEAIVHEQVRDIVEKLAKKLVPQIASEVIKSELDRLMKDADL